MVSDKSIENLTHQVMANPKYANLTGVLVTRLSQEAINKGLNGKSALKFVRNKIHQVGGAYLKEKIDYTKLIAQLEVLPKDQTSNPVLNFCHTAMKAHTSTAERLPILNTFFHTCLAPIAPVSSVMDLACGLNPLSIPWIPLAKDAQYFACDIYLDSLSFLQSFFDYFAIPGSAVACDLIAETPKHTAQVAFLLKSIPCLEQMDKTITAQLINEVHSDHILVSFPIYSLGGRNVGMLNHYKRHFSELINENNWKVQEFQFKTELAFLVSK